MDHVVKQRLEAKLVKTCMHLIDQKENKRWMLKSYNEIIRESEKRLDALASAIANDDTEEIRGIFDDVEFEDLTAPTSVTDEDDIILPVN